MIGDARRVVCGGSLQADLCIIGAGAAGITIALQLLRSDLRIVMLESGNTEFDPDVQALCEGEVVDPALHSPADKYRRRLFGGSTTIWGGRCVPFDPIDLEPRAWMPNSGWPISYDDLAEYYPTANALCEAGSFIYDAGSAIPGGMRPVVRGFAPRDFTTDRIERFSCPTDFAARWRHRLVDAPNLHILLNATCTNLRRSADGKHIEHAMVQTLEGNHFHVTARQFVVATGALEAARLLLASRDAHTPAIGNDHDLVGRFYMCHIAGTIGRMRIETSAGDVWHDYERADDGTYCRRRIALTARTQRREGIGNIVFRLHHPRIPDPSHRTGSLSAIYLARHLIQYEYGKRLTGTSSVGIRDWLRHVANVAGDAPNTARFLSHWIGRRILAVRKLPSVVARPRSNCFSLDFHAEQAPNPDSRIVLCDNTDRLGMPRIRIDWRYSEIDVQTVATAFRLLQNEFAGSGLGTLTLAADEPDVEAVIRRDGAYGGHHIGTARMGVSPREGVVDANCRVFGVSNLYVAGSAVFPTSGQANPTLTIVALAIRLARCLERAAGQAVEMVPPAVDRPRVLRHALLASLEVTDVQRKP
jgi:choline dehydrogenase-like flavoprotein